MNPIIQMVCDRLGVHFDQVDKWCAVEAGHYRFGRKAVEDAVMRTLVTLAIERAQEATDSMADMKREDIRDILVLIVANLFEQITEPAFIRKVADEVMEHLRKGGATSAGWD